MQIMQNLEYFYDNPPEEAKFIARKTSIDTPRTILYGALGAGKSLILFDYISNFKKGEFLYLNFADLRYEFLNLSDEFDKIPAIALRGGKGEQDVCQSRFPTSCRLPKP